MAPTINSITCDLAFHKKSLYGHLRGFTIGFWLVWEQTDESELLLFHTDRKHFDSVTLTWGFIVKENRSGWSGFTITTISTFVHICTSAAHWSQFNSLHIQYQKQKQ